MINPPPSNGTVPQIPLDQILTPRDALLEVGISGYRRFGGRIVDEFLPELQGQRGVRVYEEMRRNDPVIGAMLRATVDVICQMDWRADPPGDMVEDPECEAVCMFVEECWADMDLTRRDFLSDVLTMIPFGWAAFEPVFKIRQGQVADPNLPDSQYDDGRIGWARIALRKQQSLYEWVIAPNGRLQGMIQQAAPDYLMRTIPASKLVLFKTAWEAGNPEGLSYLRASYRPWYFKKNHEEVEAIGGSRDLTGMPKITIPWNASDTDKATALSILEKVHNDEQTGILVPRGQTERDDWAFELIASPGGKTIDFDTVIKRYAGEIATAFLAQFLRLGSDGRGGSYALGSTMKDFFYLALTSIADLIEETINRSLIPTLMRLNGIPEELWPEYKHGRIAAREMTVFATALQALGDAGLLGPVDVPLINTLRQELDLPEVPEGTVIEPPAPQAPVAPQNGNGPPTPQDTPENMQANMQRQASWYDLTEGDIATWLAEPA